MNLRLQLPSGVRWSGTLVAALAASAIAAGVVVTHVTPLVVDAFLPSSTPSDVDTVTPSLVPA